MNDKIRQIFESFGEVVVNRKSLSGGDINQALKITTHTGNYFLKLNKATAYPGMFAAEARGLQELQKHFPQLVPDVIRQGQLEDTQFLVLAWIEEGKPGKHFWINFGEALANLHRVSRPAFGSHPGNYIGSLAQKNEDHPSWDSFYAHCRIMPLVKKLYNSSAISGSDLKQAENLIKLLPGIFPAEPPALLHGDLWSGNFMVAGNGDACIYDPAVYYGHREMDIGMSLLFGGFDKEFYEAYNQMYPLEKGWRERVRYTQLYPLLVHAVLFGGHYVASAMQLLKGR